MKTILIILFVAISLMGSLYKRFKRLTVETENESMEHEQTFDEADDKVDEPSMQSASYFSYEYDIPAEKPVMKEKKPQPVVNEQPVAVFERNNVFDLRQAVIYQTVLCNPYIDEINQ
jgi:hypothetical protein